MDQEPKKEEGAEDTEAAATEETAPEAEAEQTQEDETPAEDATAEDKPEEDEPEAEEVTAAPAAQENAEPGAGYDATTSDGATVRIVEKQPNAHGEVLVADDGTRYVVDASTHLLVEEDAA